MTKKEFEEGFENYIQRKELIEKAESFYVPGHGPDFENMTNEQIENHIKFIEKTFAMAFGEEDEKAESANQENDY
ncbi:hypothetical protein CEY02_21005 [Bacillus pumilus]|uniref:Uncharacterized protein n=1 Tax=Bacillus pumilus TaxID=1408 RepID=A0A2A5ICM7_BACPU|nr:hypothetical protein CEY02_21005 [Bacillus pumilus]